jgi:arylformamidase
MAGPVYRNYDAEALYAQYNNRALTPEAERDAIKADQTAKSDAYRAAATRKHLDVAYGPHPRERLDLFLPPNASGADGAPLFAFIHGGYWQWNDKEGFEFLAEPLNAAGAAFANIEYALCPAVTLAELTDQCRRALAHLWREAEAYGYDRSRIVVSGHSAGGHLTAMMAATDWPSFEEGLPADLVHASLPISGVFDIEPIRLTPLNDAVQLKADDVAPLSPLFLSPTTTGEGIVAYGGAESDEFHRQAAALAEAWRDAGLKAETLELPGRNHFTALSALAEEDNALFAAARRLLGLG